MLTKWAYAGWIAFGALLLVVLRELITKWVGRFAEYLGGALFRRVQSSRWARRRALAAYRRKLVVLYEYLPNSFLDNLTLALRDVYVPLTLTGRAGTTPVDAHAAIRDARHAVITGAPGAGKSTLLKHTVLGWAEAPWDRVARDPVPVILDLHRCNDNTDDLEKHLVAQFDRTAFRRPDRFVRRALDTGGLRVMLDGFDEVASAQRSRVAGLIVDFATRYDRVQVIVTCRSAVYTGQLDAMAPARFRVDEFDDRLVQRFLYTWPAMNAAQARQLTDALRDAPRVFQLARNPLILTMIAFLYGAGTGEWRLPHHRFDFYQQIVEELLSKRMAALNTCAWPLKKKLLQLCALAAMNASDRGDQLTLPYESILLIIKEGLRALDQTGTTSEAVLTEIVERSGLLVAVDGGQSYAFAHLTMQEYFAALELATDRGGLLDRYAADPTRWRETVTLWCAVPNVDSTKLIASIRGSDPVLAFECLAEAHEVDDQLAGELIVASQSLLSDAGSDPRHPIVTAFGLVAADPSGRGRQVFDFLAVQARDRDPARAVPALNALAATALPDTVRVIADLAEEFVPAREALTRIGDLAVPRLVELAPSTRWALDALRAIGTPAAAAALVGLMWSTGPAPYRAAWHLATLIDTPAVYDALATADVPPVDETTRTLRWAWSPWAAGPDDRRTDIVARIVQLLGDTAALDHRPPHAGVMESRIMLALTMVGGRMPFIGFREVLEPPVHAAARRLTAHERFRQLPESPDQPVDVYRLKSLLTDRVGTHLRSADHDLVRDWLLRKAVSPQIVDLLTSADDRLVRPIADALINSVGVTTTKDWLRLSATPPIRFVFSRSRWFYIPLALLWLPILAGFGLAVARLAGAWHWGPHWLAWGAVAAVPVFAIAHTISFDADYEDLLLTTSAGLPAGLMYVFDGLDAEDRFTGAGIALGWCGMMLCDVYAAVGLASVLGWPATAVLLATAVVAAGIHWRVGAVRQHHADSPLPALMAIAVGGGAGTDTIASVEKSAAEAPTESAFGD